MPLSSFDVISHKHWKTRTATLKSRHRHTDSQCSQCSCRNIAVMWSHSRAQTVHDAYIQNASLSRLPSATVVSTEPFSHGTGTLRCLQKKMATCRLWSVSLRRDSDDVPHCQILYYTNTIYDLWDTSTSMDINRWAVLTFTHDGRLVLHPYTCLNVSSICCSATVKLWFNSATVT